jgi:hypothetical protein
MNANPKANPQPGQQQGQKARHLQWINEHGDE